MVSMGNYIGPDDTEPAVFQHVHTPPKSFEPFDTFFFQNKDQMSMDNSLNIQ